MERFQCFLKANIKKKSFDTKALKMLEYKRYESHRSPSNKVFGYTSKSEMLYNGGTLKREEYNRVGDFQYRTKDLIGNGFSSKVYRAYHLENPNQVFAIKVINLEKFKSSSLKLLQNQVSIHQCLDHPNILRCHEVYKTKQFYYIITEYCSGGSLLDLLKEKKKLSEMVICDLMKQLIRGYQYLNKINILHRDLKPANILKMGDVWKICDFGFSARVKEDHFVDLLNVGTPLYMPLEALKSNKYSVKTDIFAMGIILYEMIVGHTPWSCKTEKQLVEKIQKEQIQLPKVNNWRIEQFLKRTVIINEQERGGRQVLQIFASKELCVGPVKHLHKIKSSLSKLGTLTKLLSPHSQTSTEISQISEYNTYQKDIFKQNTNKLINQLQLCRLVYYMVQNIDYFLLQYHQRQFFAFVLFKFLVQKIKSLDASQLEGLKLWESYEKSQEYQQLSREIKAYENRYEKEYAFYLKRTEIHVIKEVNRKFPEFTCATKMSQQFYHTYIGYIRELLRLLNHQVMDQLVKYPQLPPQYMQALDSLYLYYSTLLYHSHPTPFSSPPNMHYRILTNYLKSTYDSSKYMILRAKIRTL